MVRGMVLLSFRLLVVRGVVFCSSFPDNIRCRVWVVVCIVVFCLGSVVCLESGVWDVYVVVCGLWVVWCLGADGYVLSSGVWGVGVVGSVS